MGSVVVATRTRARRTIVGAVALALFVALLAACNSPGLTVTFSRSPAIGTITVTVTVTDHTVTQATARIDSSAATPVFTTTMAAFSFNLDTTQLTDGAHKLVLSVQTTTGTLTGIDPFTVANSPRLPAGFVQSVAFGGLTQPTVVQFAPDGRVFVAEKTGLILVFSSINATTPTVFADLRTEVYSGGGHGLLGMVLDPSFPTNPYVYVLYSLDAPIGGTPPVWNDKCPNPPGAEINGCVVSGRLSRLQADGNVMTGSEQVLINDWCEQFSSHAIGTLLFGADGALYASAGDGGTYASVDYGQLGTPVNPCGDPPVPVGGTQAPPSAEGGALRAQSLLRPPTDPVSLDGSIIRVDPATGAALPDNPNAGASDPNARRIVAEGLRNPFRMALRPGTNELWIGDVGWNTWEEIDRDVDPTAQVANFGWPCYEGNATQPQYDDLNLDICNTLYASAAAIPPYYQYQHGVSVASGDGCPTSPTSITGGSFYPTSGGSYPSNYDGALFFGDNSRNCIWVMLAGSNGLPDPTTVQSFVTGPAGVGTPVDLVSGPGGDLFYADLTGGAIRRISYDPGNHAPVAALSASPTGGTAPLIVSFDARASTDADQDPLTYSWDLNGDGVFGDSTAPNPTFTYSTAGTFLVSVKVTDPYGASAIASVTISVQNTAPGS